MRVGLLHLIARRTIRSVIKDTTFIDAFCNIDC